MPENYFDGPVAAGYDEFEADMFERAAVEPVVDFLAELAGTGRALELGVGTGRIALPLQARGVEVHGIELSPAMAGQLRAKPGGPSIPVTIGDFATATAGGTFRLAYLVFNTIMNLTTQREQSDCFANVAAQLETGGRFVVEVMVPQLQRLSPGETVVPNGVSPTALDFDEYDVAAQGVVSHHYRTIDGRLVLFSMPFRYVWPAELDLMARLAGLSLAERWSDWRRVPFTSTSGSHVSVWVKD